MDGDARWRRHQLIERAVDKESMAFPARIETEEGAAHIEAKIMRLVSGGKSGTNMPEIRIPRSAELSQKI